ncbi:MAG: zf-HC2 domain-containing protein [Chloroflexi bacterium]|nr:zf-HC2 domain-containing protein [Chloroflexota bacterium]
MTCDPRLLSYYRDGTLSPRERHEVDAHLAVCTECTQALRGLMRLAQVVRSMPMVSVPPTVRQGVYAALQTRERQRPQPSFFGGLGRALAPAAVAAAVAVSAIVTFRPGAVEAPAAPAPIAASAEQPAVAAQPQAPGPATAAQAVPGNASVASSVRSSQFAPVSQDGPAALPIKIVNPAVVPEPIQRLYSANAQVRELLGAASPGSKTVTLLEQSFQGGLAIRRSDTREIYVLRREGNTWSVHQDTWRPGDRISVDVAPPPGAMVPAAGFGSIWRSTPEIKTRLGWAVYEPRGSGGMIQTYEHGLVVWTPHGLLYVLSNDGRWRTFPDASPL